jgi:hypothetical protein
MKFNFNKKKFIEILIFILIILFSCLIFYELYNLAYNYSKSIITEGLTLQSIITQSTVDPSNVDINSLCNAIVTDISNIQILDNNINNISSTVNSLIISYNNTNQNSNQTSINSLKLTSINDQNSFSCSLDNNNICSAINNNITNINTINTNIQSTINSINQLPNGSSDMNNIQIQNITAQNTISPCPSSSNILTSSICQTENTNINNIYTLSANISSLNNLVTNLQNQQNDQANQVSNVGNNIASQVGITVQ